MKPLLMLVFCVFSLFASCASGEKDVAGPGAGDNSSNNPNPTGGKMKIKIGDSTFTATLCDNATAAALRPVANDRQYG